MIFFEKVSLLLKFWFLFEAFFSRKIQLREQVLFLYGFLSKSKKPPSLKFSLKRYHEDPISLDVLFLVASGQAIVGNMGATCVGCGNFQGSSRGSPEELKWP